MHDIQIGLTVVAKNINIFDSPKMQFYMHTDTKKRKHFLIFILFFSHRMYASDFVTVQNIMFHYDTMYTNYFTMAQNFMFLV